MRPSRAVLRTLQLSRNASPALNLGARTVPKLVVSRHLRSISSRLLRQPSPELLDRLQTVATTQQLRALLPKAVEAESTLVSTIVGILRDRNEFEYFDCTHVLRDIRYALSNKNRNTSVADSRKAMQDILRKLKDEKKWLDEAGQAETVRINVLLGDEAAMSAARQTVDRWGDSVHWPLIFWNAYVELLYAQRDVEGLERALRTFRERFDADIPTRALDCIVILRLQQRIDSKSEVNAHDLVAAVDSLDQVDRTSRVWAAGIRHLLESVANSDKIAVEVSETLRDKGIEPDYRIALALISPLCAPEAPNLDLAMVLYNEYLASGSAEMEGGEFNNGIFISLLSACARTLDLKHTKIALRILNDMRSRRLSFPTPTLSSIAVSLIKSSPDHQTAFNLYAHLYALHPRALDREAYDVILATFVKLSTPTSTFAPARLYLEIIGDIRKAGYQIGPHPITSLLRSYGLQARISRKTSSDPEYRQSKLSSLLNGVSELHTMIKLDPSIQVDVPLLNALMDAFARVGAYAESFEVWDELVERRPRERQEDLVDLYSPSINIYLDACGYSYSLLRARKAWAWAGRWGLSKDRRNWEAWLECLCRCGRIEEAVDTVLKIKKGKEKGAPGVTKGMVALLLKFSWRSKETYRTVKEQVKVEFPEYWEELKDIVTTKSTSADE